MLAFQKLVVSLLASVPSPHMELAFHTPEVARVATCEGPTDAKLETLAGAV